jgi:anoctamin-10
LTLFGLAFPVSYLLAFITNVAEIQVNKVKLNKFSRRPFPQGASNIGNWLIILEVITFFAIFSNAGLIVYTSQSITNNQIVTFSILLVVFLGTKYFIRFIIPDEPESAIILNKRH